MNLDTGLSSRCRSCSTDIAPGLLACPGCGSLVHADALKELSSRASRAAAAADISGELQAWRALLPLLPPSSKQFGVVHERVLALSRAVENPAAPHASGRRKWLSSLGPVGAAILALASKGKLLLLGLTKASTVIAAP